MFPSYLSTTSSIIQKCYFKSLLHFGYWYSFVTCSPTFFYCYLEWSATLKLAKRKIEEHNAIGFISHLWVCISLIHLNFIIIGLIWICSVYCSRGLINDGLYAEMFSRSRWSSSSWGPRRIKQVNFSLCELLHLLRFWAYFLFFWPIH